MTRNGKIARLPLVIRQQLNQRLPNGESAQDLLSWLKPRIRQALGVGAEYGPDAAPESLLSKIRT